jgi:hypothetical protein
MGELLYLILAVWFLAVPLFLTLTFSAGKGRSVVWPFAGATAGAVAFVYVRDLVAAMGERLDVVTGALIPIAAGTLASLAFTLAVHRMPAAAGSRRWRGHLLDSGGASPCTLSVDGNALSLDTPQVRLRLPRWQLTEVARDASVVRLRWRSTEGDIASASFLVEDDGAQDPLVHAGAIVTRIRRLLALGQGGLGSG